MAPVLEKLLDGLKAGGVLIISDFHPFLSLNKSKRTFRDPESGTVSEVRHYVHLFEEYFKCFIQKNAAVEAFEEPRYQETPVVFVIKVKKM
jgi:hypothetical protein